MVRYSRGSEKYSQSTIAGTLTNGVYITDLETYTKSETYYKESNYPYPRFGLAIGKKIGNAVMRNKLKRIFRMILTNNKNLFKNNYDYIIIGKRRALETNYSTLEDSIKNIISGD